MNTFGREATEYNRMDHAQPDACLHGHHRLDRHRQINNGTIALFIAQRFQAVGKLTYPIVEFTIGNSQHLAVVGFKNNGGFIFGWRSQMAVKAISRHIQLTVGKPFIERRLRLIEHLREGGGPIKMFFGQTPPKLIRILLCFLYQIVVSLHTGNGCVFLYVGKRWKHTIFNQHRFNICRCHSHYSSFNEFSWPDRE